MQRRIELADATPTSQVAQSRVDSQVMIAMIFESIESLGHRESTMARLADGSTLEQLGRPSRVFRLDRSITSGRSSRRRAMTRTLMVLVGLGVIWRIARYAACPPLWGDEAFLAVNVLIRDFAGLLRPLEYYQIAPGGFLWGELAVVRALGKSEWALRLIPFVAGLASLGLFLPFATKTLDRRSALLAVGIFAASFYPVRHATEAKPYATDLLFSLLTTSLAWSVWLERESARRWSMLAGVVGVGVWCSYPLVFVAAGVGSVLAFRVGSQPSRRAITLFLAFGLATSASWATSYLTIAREQAKSAPFYTSLGTWQGAFPPFEESWKMAFWLLDVHTGNMLAYPNGGNYFGSLATAILVAVGCLALLKSRPALLAMLLSPLAANLLAACLRRYPYGTSARTTLFMAPAFCLLAGLGLVTLIRRLNGQRRRRAYRIATISLAGMMVIASVANVALPYKNYEDTLNREAVDELASMARPGDRWIAYDGVEELPVSKSLMLEHWLQQMAEVRYNMLAKAPVPVQWMPDEAGVDVAESGRTWLIVHRSGCPQFDENRLERLKVKLASSLGSPKARIERLTRGESIESFEYPAPIPPLALARPERRGGR
jgi:Dolichyl-phosphate-mannose-protein mannosyltransferase